MGDSETVRNSRSGPVSAAVSRLRSLLSENDARIADLVGQLAERDARLAGMEARIADLVGQLSGRDARLAEMEVQLSEQAGLVRELRDEILRLNRQPKRPDLKPSGSGGGKGGSGAASGGPKPGGGKGQDKGQRKRRGPRRPNPDLRRREVKVTLDGVPKGAVQKGFQDTIRCATW